MVARRRRRKQLLERLTSTLAARDLLALEFCRRAAKFDDSPAYERLGSASAVEWMTEHLHLTVEVAGESIAIGRRLMSGALTA
jgi:hypothetical protein